MLIFKHLQMVKFPENFALFFAHFAPKRRSDGIGNTNNKSQERENYMYNY